MMPCFKKKFNNKECPATRAHDEHLSIIAARGGARIIIIIIISHRSIASSRDNACDYNGLMLIRFLALLT